VVYNQMGQQIYNVANESRGNVQIDLSNHSPGIYFISINDGKQLVQQKIIIH